MKIILLVCAFLALCNISHGQVGKNCNNDNECQDKMICENQKCKCGVTFREGNQKDCINIIGSSCESGDECSNFPGAMCNKDHTCVCPAGLLAGSKECNKIGQAGDECTLPADCIHRVSPPDDNKECKEKKCVCRLNMHEGSNGICRPTKMLRDICSSQDDCFLADSKNNNALECVEGACQCKKGYVENEDKCNGAATKFILSTSTLLLVIMAILKM